MKTCPHCMKTISETARKCKFCGNWVNEKEDIIDSQSDKKLNLENRESDGMNKKKLERLIIAIAGWCPISYRIGRAYCYIISILILIILLIFWIVLFFNARCGKK